jgi:Niemann-Pick C1 protein
MEKFAERADKENSALEFVYIAPQSVQREFYESSVGSGMNMAIGTFIMFAFAICTLGRCEVVGGRKLVACVGIVSVWLAVGAAFGVSMWCGYIYTPFSQFMPLLALGLGVDDMYIIVAALEQTYRDEPTLAPDKRMGRALRHAGVSITLTSLTDFVAFAAGSSTRIPAMKFFCFHMAWAVLFDLIFQCTFFVAALALDERRQARGRADCC